MLLREVVSLNVLSCLVLLLLLFSVVQSEKVSAALKRQSLIYYEPPYEINHERADQVTEHYITQRLDNFDHQNKETFQMVRLNQNQSWQHWNWTWYIFSVICKMRNISNLVDQFLYSLVVNGKSALVIFCLVSTFMISPRNSMAYWYTLSIVTMAKPYQPSIPICRCI